jgi:hypothetical protein
MDGYTFTSRVSQTTHPLPTLANVGLSSETSLVMVEGTVDQQADQIELSIREQSGHLLDGLGQIDLRVQDGEVWGQVQGQEWEALDASQAPDTVTSNPSAFLQAAKNVQLAREEERLGQVFQVFTFELDGTAWAEEMRQALQAEMTSRGELAPGEALERLTYYEEMTGVGTLWVSEQGSPQRLDLRLVYPPLPGESEYREVETVTDYNEWEGGTNTLSFLSRNLEQVRFQSAEDVTSTLSISLLAALFLVFPLALIRYRRNPGFYRATMLFMVAAIISEPLMNATVVRAADVRRTERQTAIQETLAENERIESAVEEIEAEFASQFNVTEGAMAAATIAATIEAQVASLTDGPAPQVQPSVTAQQPTEDADGDGVDNGTEVLLGLDAVNPDTDGDLLSDSFEVTGINLGGRSWYLDPLNTDTNGDGVQDSLECIQAIDVVVNPSGIGTKTAPNGDGTCADTDGDGTPDFADDDNDNDSVTDWMDGQTDSRFGDVTSGVPNQTFAYGVDHYSSGKPLRITFEVRPTNPQHLWYSMNVLDWPGGDYEGQIRRVHDTTLGTTGAAANGDMQLVPMIEIVLPASEASHLPTQPGKTPVVGDNSRLAEWLDMAVLERYQMAVAWTQDKQSLQVYLPATLIRDKHGNAPVNFVAKMLYWPNGTGLFSTNHAARLVWLVQMDVDNCIVPENSTYSESCTPEGANYQNGIHWQTTKKQMVHRYYDSFYVTAFTAEEELSANGQIFYENPAQVSNPTAYVPDQLLGLGTVMESYLRRNQTPAQALASFKTQKPTIGTRLEAGNPIQDADSYGLLAKLATQEAPRILDSVFASHREQIPYSTLLYVTWGESKMTGLQGVPSGDSLRLNMSEGAQKSATTIRLGSFTYNPNPATIGGRQNPNWDPADPGKVWLDYLQGQSGGAYQQLPQTAQQQFTSEQFQQVTLSTFWNLARGVELNNDLSKPLSDNLSEVQGLVDELGAAFDNAGENTIGALISVFDDFQEAQESLSQSAQNSLLSLVAGKDIKNPANLRGALKAAKFAKGFGLASVTFAGASATLSVVLALKDQMGLSAGAVTALEAVNATIGAVLGALQLTQEITKLIQSAQALGGYASALSFQSTLSWVGAVAAGLVAVVILVTAVTLYFKLVGDKDTVAARTALAQGVATAIIVLLLFVISALFPIGTAIALLIGLLDGINTAICKIINWTGGQDGDGQTYEDRHKARCAGIVGNVTAAIVGLFYKSVPMVDMAYKDRLRLGQTDTKLIPVDNLVGMNAGNRLQITQPVTVTVRLPEEHSLNKVLEGGDWQNRPGFIGVDERAPMSFADYTRLIKEKNIFNYELITDQEAEKNSDLAGRTTPGAWIAVGQAENRDWLYKTVSPTIQITLSAGINWNPDLFVREYYRYSLAECGLFAGGCDYQVEHFDKTKQDTQAITIGTNLIYDIFPSTLTDFYTLEQVQENGQFTNRYRLAWGGDKLPFPTLMDADGDGLRVDLDPDDKSADTDGDALPDAFEVQDARLNPLAKDSDGDGLTDYDEVRRGTRPDRADSDGDGLSDNDESIGWELIYVDASGTTQRTWVTADPLVFDTDGDTLSDQQERILAIHPRARNTDLSVLSLRTTTNQTSSTFLAPNQTIAFTSTVRNELRGPVAYGLLESEILNSTQAMNPVTFELQPQQSTSILGTIQAPAAPISSSAEITLRNRAGANLIDPNASYADQLRGLAQPNGLRFHLNFEQRSSTERNFPDVTGNATLTCPNDYCPSVVRSTNSDAAFGANGWYLAEGSNLAFSQPRFSIGGWVTPERAFGAEYNERVILGPDNVSSNTNRYLQLSLVDLQSDSPKAKIHFTATDGAACEQVFTALTVPYGQKTHIFVTYDGMLVHGYRNGQLVGSYNLQNCANKVPAGNRFTIGRGTTDATLYVDNVYYRSLDEGAGLFSAAEPYLQLNSTKEPFWQVSGVKDEQTRPVGKKLNLRTSATPDGNSTVYLCEEDQGEKQGQCRSDSSLDSDDLLGTVTVDPRRNGAFNTSWSSGEGSGTLRYNVQNNFFQGRLDDLRIYENTLSAQDVRQVVSGGGLIYQLDEASGRTQFRNAGVDATHLLCGSNDNCPTSGLKGYSGQGVRFTGSVSQTLTIERLREQFGSNLVASFWFRPEAGSSTASPMPLLRYGQGADGFTLFATQQEGTTSLRGRFNYSQTDPIGGSGGNAYQLACNDGEALVGIYGGAGGAIDRVGPVCVTTTPDYQSWTGSPVRRGSAGGGGGSGFERICPTGSYVVGFGGRSGAQVDRIELACAQPASAGVLNSRASSYLEAVGGGGGSVQTQRVCPSNLPANGIVGRAGSLVDQFGLSCQSQVPTSSSVILPANQWSHVTVAQSDDNLLLYVNGQPMQSIWFGPSARAEYRLSGAYRPDFTLGNGVVGLVDELKLQGLDASATRTAQVGGGGGNSYDLRCQINEALVGLYGRSGGAVDQVGALCATIDQNGQWVGNPVRRGSAGGNGGGEFERRCAVNAVVTGFRSRAGAAVDQLQPVCTPLTDNGATDSGASTSTLDPVGGDGGSAQPLMACPSGLPATGLFGRAGTRLDAFGLQCGELAHTDARQPYADRALGYLALDETAGSTTFVNSTGQGNLVCANAESCPQAGLKGQVRESLQFNNSSTTPVDATPRLTLPDVTDSPFSFALWVRMPTAPPDPASLVALHASETDNDVAWRLQLVNSNGQTVPQLVGSRYNGSSCSGSFEVTPRNVNLAVNQWYHLGVNYDPTNGRNDVSLYLNGRLIHQERLDNLICRTGTTLRFGQSYRGQLDEFSFYGKSLAVNEFLSQYVYQSTWYDAVSTDQFRVDYHAPTIRLTAGGFVQPGTTIFGVAVSDAESGIRWVEYKDADGTWKPAHAETATTGVWTFGRDVQATALIEVRATDNVGNVSTDSQTVNVDSTAPVATMNAADKQRVLTAQGTVSDSGSGVQSVSVMIIAPNGDAFSPPRSVPVTNGTWQASQELPPTVNGRFQIWVSTVDQLGNQFQGAVGSVLVDNSAPTPSLGDTPTELAGVGENRPIVRGGVTDWTTSGGSEEPSAVQKVEVGLLHRRDKDDPSKVHWQDATLGSTGQITTTWQLQLPADLEGIYDISLRARDALGNERTVYGVWTGVVDTRGPRIALSGLTPGQQRCTVTDFSLGRSIFRCGDITGTSGASSALYASGVFTEAGLIWDASWYRALFQDRTPADRLYALYQTGANFTTSNVAESCDIYGNCTRCTVTIVVDAPACSEYSGDRLARGGESQVTAAEAPFDPTLTGPGVFTTTISYERPDAYEPGTEPNAPTSEWVEINEPYTLVDDAVLASTRPFAAAFTEAHTEIRWTASMSATQYYVGWTLNETAELSELMLYSEPDVHTQLLPDQGRFYAHVVAIDAEGESRAFTMGPVYFDGAPPATYLNWDEFGPGLPYWLWEEALSATGQPCNLLGVEDRAAIFSNGTSARSGEQLFYGTWDDQWLAVHWSGVNLDEMGDLHLYIDSKAGGGIYAHNPYTSIDLANSLVVMPERRQYQSDTVDRMLADYAVFVEDAETVRLLQWDGSGWESISTAGLRFTVIDETVYVWLPLTLLGVEPSTVDVSLVGFVSEEESMEIWATMPGNNPLNSPAVLPSHLPPAISVERTLVNLQTSMRLSADPNVNNTLDNCPTNVLFDESLLDVQFNADPAGEVYDPVLYEGVRAVVPDDVEPVLASLCTGVDNPAPDTVCALAEQVAENAGGAGPEPGPTGQLPATAGPRDELVFYATIHNLSSQESGHITLEVEGDLPANGSVLHVGVLAPFESRVISFTETVDPNADYDFTEMTIYPVEEVEDIEDNIIITYEHVPHTVFHDIDRSAPTDAELDERLLDDLIGVGEQLLEGVVYDQSPVTEVVLQTSLGETVTCNDTLRADAFTTAWSCPVTIPDNTPDGTLVDVALSATDAYGFASDIIAEWTFEVDNLAPDVTLIDETDANRVAGVNVSAPTTETLRLEGVAGDERLLAGVQVCDEIEGFSSCQEAELSFGEEITATLGLDDEAYWAVERSVDRGIEGATVPVTITAYDAAGNGAQLSFDVLIDTLAPAVTVDEAPVTQIDFDGPFSLSGTATDRSGVHDMVLEVQDPLGEIGYYPVELTTPGGTSTTWTYMLGSGKSEFAIPGEYTYVVLAYDSFDNEWESQPYHLSVLAEQSFLNPPFFVSTSNDLWDGFAPGAPLYMQVEFDDADLPFGDNIAVTMDPFPAWLTMTRLDERTVEISGTIPMTITEELSLQQPRVEEGEVITPLLQINVGMTLADTTGRQAYQSWVYEQEGGKPSALAVGTFRTAQQPGGLLRIACFLTFALAATASLARRRRWWRVRVGSSSR